MGAIYYEDKLITSLPLIAEVIYNNNQIKIQEEIRQAQEADRQEAYNQSLAATSACVTATGLANDATDNANAVATQLENETKKIFKPSVTNFADLATTYPTPENGWTVTVASESVSYRYSGTLSQWINIGYISTAEIATDTQVGLVKGGGNVVIDGTGKVNVPTVGDVSTLATTEKTNTVGAINELHSDIGDLTQLTTESNTDLVGAINENKADIGIKSNLNTTEKGNLVGAINEVIENKLDKTGDASNTTVTFTEAATLTNIASTETHATLFGKIKKFFSFVGTTTLTTTAQTISGAINELVTSLSGKFNKSDIVQTTTDNDAAKVPSSAVTKALADQITTLNGNLHNLVIATVTGVTSATVSNDVTMNYPEGFTSSNSFILSAMIYFSTGNSWYIMPYIKSGVAQEISLEPSYVRVINQTTTFVNSNIKIVLGRMS